MGRFRAFLFTATWRGCCEAYRIIGHAGTFGEEVQVGSEVIYDFASSSSVCAGAKLAHGEAASGQVLTVLVNKMGMCAHIIGDYHKNWSNRPLSGYVLEQMVATYEKMEHSRAWTKRTVDSFTVLLKMKPW